MLRREARDAYRHEVEELAKGGDVPIAVSSSRVLQLLDAVDELQELVSSGVTVDHLEAAQPIEHFDMVEDASGVLEIVPDASDDEDE